VVAEPVNVTKNGRCLLLSGGSNPSIIASFYPQRNYANYVMIQIENSPDQYLNSLMLGDAADYKDFPDITHVNSS
jgi:hypothetical protein